jgi:basic amino acid/polyamine antiporter, APA family
MRRELRLGGATMMGLGSMIGTGVFVSIGVAAGVAGPAVVLAIAIAALVATCNALSSAQLAASHSVSGGTYEYGYVYLTPAFGFAAGWMFLLAKSASAATAALGFSGYLLNLFGSADATLRVIIAVAGTIALTLTVLGGIRRSNAANIVIVSVTLIALFAFVAAGAPAAMARAADNLVPFFGKGTGGEASAALLHATALMFVAYTGYGRIATMGEEVHDPQRTIPRAIIVTVIVTMVLYIAVALVAVASVGAGTLAAATSEKAAPLEVIARQFNVPAVRWLIAAITAMLGVLLNLILGLSRVLLAMGRRGDMPARLGRLDPAGTPASAVIVVGVIIAGLAMIGSVRVTWSFSAFTVLIYYAITNLAALQLPQGQRLYWRIVPWVGLVACTALAFFVEWQIWTAGLALLAAGLGWHLVARRRISGRTT